MITTHNRGKGSEIRNTIEREIFLWKEDIYIYTNTHFFFLRNSSTKFYSWVGK